MIPFTAYTKEDFETATSYLSVEEADGIISNRNESETWNDYDVPTKEALLIQASLAVDGAYNYQGVKVSNAQFLKFPRKELGDEEVSKVLPLTLKFAVTTLCLSYSNNKAFRNITREEISKLVMEFKEIKDDIGADVLVFLKPLKATTLKIEG